MIEKAARDAIAEHGTDAVSLLHRLARYPTPDESVRNPRAAILALVRGEVFVYSCWRT